LDEHLLVEEQMSKQQSAKKNKSTLPGFSLLLISLGIYTVAWLTLNGKGSGAGFELALIWTPLAYLFLLPGCLLLLSSFRRWYPSVVLLTGAILIVFDHFFSATLETGNTSGYAGIGAVVNFIIGLLAIPLIFIGLWLLIEGFIRILRQHRADASAQRGSSRVAFTVSLIILLSLFVLDAGLTWWIYSNPACAGYWWITATCKGPFSY
jgi:hypothetical protein